MKTKLLATFVLLIFILSAFPVNADVNPYMESYMGYMDDAAVPEFENININGVGSVNLFSGAATYSYPIKVPEGVNGLKPAISLNYNHQSTNAIPTSLGYAWDLNRFEIVRNINYTRSDTSDDYYELYLNGARHKLIPIGGDEYRTEIETYLKIEYISDEWFVYQTDGTVYEFGTDTDSTMESSEENYVSIWALNIIKDVYDNEIDYYYYNANGRLKIYTISYGDAEVIFSYDANTLIRREIFEQGHEKGNVYALDEIEIYYDNNLIRSYELDYYTFPDEFGERIMLDTITEKGSSGGTLNNVQFDYYEQSTGWSRDTNYDLPSEIEEDFDKGQRFVDINRDGLIDYLYAYQYAGDDWDEAEVDVWLNNGNGWTSSNWDIPFAFTFRGDRQEGTDRGVRLSDVDGDGYTDFLVGSQLNDGDCDDDLPSNELGLHINTGATFSDYQNPHNYDIPEFVDWDYNAYFLDYSYDNNKRIVDVNGDGLVDYLNEGIRTYINNGNEWIYINNDWLSPHNFANGEYLGYDCEIQWGVNQGVYFIDINGDGLNDMLVSYDNDADNEYYDEIYINDGKDFILSNTWNPPTDFLRDEYDQGTCDGSLANDLGIRLADVNGDGLIDILKSRPGTDSGVYINNGYEWDWDTNAWEPLDDFVEDIGYSPGFKSTDSRLIELNGDGLIDYIKNGDMAYINNGAKNFLLEKITNEYGAEITFDYESSTEYQPNGGELGFNVWLVSSIAFDNDMWGAHDQILTYNYEYEGGKYNYDLREFQGFDEVIEIKPDNSYVEHLFHQDKPLTGIEYQTTIYDSNDDRYSMKSNNYVYNQNLNYVVELDDSCDRNYNGGNNYYDYCVYLEYDNYGNVIEKHEDGEVGVTNNERYTHYDYVYNTAEWIVNKPMLEEVRDENDIDVVKETRFYYDNLNYGNIGNYGGLTKTEELISGSNNYKEHLYDYDSYGNLVEETDDNGYTTTYIYDNYNLYVEDVTNALNQVYHYEYDPGTGNIILDEDPNNYLTEYEYDEYGRITKEIQEYDTPNDPTISYDYYFDGNAPEYVIKNEKETSGETYDTIYYYDGLGKVIQTKKDDESDSNDILTNIYYDENNQISDISHPYSHSATSSYSNPDTNVEKISYQYDPLGRETIITKPDGSTIENEYTKYYTQVTDENGNYKKYYHDGFWNTDLITEFNNGNLDSTQYFYNDLDLLTEIIDSEGNVFTFYYDYLGRMTSLEDPDLGDWDYTYDGEGNLLTQEDSEGNLIGMSYDELNRITYKNSTQESIHFEYDLNTIGTLTRITKPNYQIEYEYDDRLRVELEEIIIDGEIFTREYDYDSKDRVTEINLDSGSKEIQYEFNDGNSVNKVKENNFEIINDVSYEDSGAKEQVDYDNNLQTNYDYYSDTLRLREIQTTGSVQELEYTYDDVGNIMSIDDLENNIELEMVYDDLDRLTGVNRTSNSGTDDYEVTYNYDSIGNILDIWFNNEHYDFTYQGNPVHSPSEIDAPSMLESCDGIHYFPWGIGCYFVNDCPIVESYVDVVEGHLAIIEVNDPDGDSLNITYSNYFNQNGEWQTQVGDEGDYYIDVTADDGYCFVNEEVHVEVYDENDDDNNDPLVIEHIEIFDFSDGDGDDDDDGPLVIDHIELINFSDDEEDDNGPLVIEHIDLPDFTRDLFISNVELITQPFQNPEDAVFEITSGNDGNIDCDGRIAVGLNSSNTLDIVVEQNYGPESEIINQINYSYDCSDDLKFHVVSSVSQIGANYSNDYFYFSKEDCWSLTPELSISYGLIINSMDIPEDPAEISYFLVNDGSDVNNVNISLSCNACNPSWEISDIIPYLGSNSDILDQFIKNVECETTLTFEVNKDQDILEEDYSNNIYEFDVVCPEPQEQLPEENNYLHWKPIRDNKGEEEENNFQQKPRIIKIKKEPTVNKKVVKINSDNNSTKDLKVRVKNKYSKEIIKT
ncbi:MAG: toxin TcdB middle/N-terminal domain-containing protein [archaeon]